jgi:two-component system, LytTR family, response regulator
MSYTYIIIDDDTTSIAKTKQVAARFSNLSFVASGSTYEDAINLVLEHQPSLVFLEIDPLNKQSNLSLAMINEWYRYLQVVPQIIITTNKKELAFDALKYEPLDYLLKPLELNDFRKAVFKLDKVLKTNSFFTENQNQIVTYEVVNEPVINEVETETIEETSTYTDTTTTTEHYVENSDEVLEITPEDKKEEFGSTPTEISEEEKELIDMNNHEALEKEVIEDELVIEKNDIPEPEKIVIQKEQSLIICIKSYGDYRYIDSNDILYFEADNNSTDIHLNNGEMITAFKTMKHFESILPQTHFLRIHNSYIININQVSRIHTGNTVCYIKNSTTKLPFSKSYKENVDLIIARIASGNYLEI